MPQTRPSSPWLRLAVAFAPLLVCVALAWAVTGGPLGFGGGEKDLLLVLPLVALALVYALVSLLMWALRASLSRASGVAVVVSLVTLVVAIVVVAVIFGR